MERIATIYTVNLTDWQDDDGAKMQRLLGCLPAEVGIRAARYRSKQDADRHIVSDALKRVAACLEKGLSLREIEFIRDGYGKPSLMGFSDYYFNVSHSVDWIVCAVSAKGRIGIDVEYIALAEAEVAELCFTPRELAEWRMQPAGQRDAFFFELWTLKESYAKAIGKGLSIGLSSLETIRYPEMVRMRHQGNIDPELHLRVVPFAPGYKLSVCMPQEEQPIDVRHFSLDEMLARLSRFTEQKVEGSGSFSNDNLWHFP